LAAWLAFYDIDPMKKIAFNRYCNSLDNLIITTTFRITTTFPNYYDILKLRLFGFFD